MSYFAIGLEKYFSNTFYKSPFLPKLCTIYPIPNRAFLFLKVIALLLSRKKNFDPLIIQLIAFFKFEHKCRKYGFFKVGIIQFFSMMVAYLYVGHLFFDHFRIDDKAQSKVVLIPAFYTPYGLIVADYCTKYNLTFADMQHGDCNANIFYSQMYIKKFNSFFDSPMKFYVRTKNRYIHFVEILNYCDLEVLYEPLPSPKPHINNSDCILIYFSILLMRRNILSMF